MNLQWVHTSDLESAGQSGTHFFMSQVLDLPTFTWNAIINNHERCYTDNSEWMGQKINGIGYMMGGWLDNHIMNGDLREVAGPIREELRTFKEAREYTTHLYCSLGPQAKTFGKHRDKADVFFVPIIGKVTMKVWDSKVHKYNMTPGDVLYIPAGMDHSSEPVEPRASFSFGLDF